MSTIGIELFGKQMKNPLILASGILGVTKAGMEQVVKKGAGGVTTKSLSLEPRKGHENPMFIETEAGGLNAVGYTNPGIEHGIKELSGWNCEESLIISIVGKDEKEFGVLAKKVEEHKQKLNAAAVEVVISCPHTPGYGLMAGQGTVESVGNITREVKKNTDLPVIIKLSPSAPGEVEQAKIAQKQGADGINMGNTMGPGMVIDIERKKPVLGFGRGGLSGPAIKPITMRCVYDIYDAIEIPIIGTGGINSYNDVIEFAMAGASAMGIGTAVYYKGPEVFQQIADDTQKWLEEHGYKNIKEIVGVAHE